jgi:hypothetical protein
MSEFVLKNDIIRMIVEDDKLFAPKEAKDMEPLSRIDYIKNRREELLRKIDFNSKKDLDNLKCEVSKQFEEYKSEYIQDFHQEARKTTHNFSEKLDFDLTSFEKNLKNTLEDINKPIDLLDGDHERAIRFKEMKQLFDYKEYVRNEMEIQIHEDPKKQNTKFMLSSGHDLFGIPDDNLKVLEKPDLVKKGCFYKFQNMFKKVTHSKIFLRIKEKLEKKKFLIK